MKDVGDKVFDPNSEEEGTVVEVTDKKCKAASGHTGRILRIQFKSGLLADLCEHAVAHYE